MEFSEIAIAVLLAIIFLVVGAYGISFRYNCYKKKKEYFQEYHEAITEEKSKGKIVSTILLLFLFTFSIFSFTSTIIYRTMPMFGNSYYVSIVSNSMASKNSANKYLETYKLDNQIAQYNIAEINKLENNEIKLYDIILFEHDNQLIIHRVVNIVDGKYITQGDANPKADDFIVNIDQIKGIYNKSLPFMSFINYLSYTPGLYVLLIGTTLLLIKDITFDILEKKFQTKSEEEKSDVS